MPQFGAHTYDIELKLSGNWVLPSVYVGTLGGDVLCEVQCGGEGIRLTAWEVDWELQ